MADAPKARLGIRVISLVFSNTCPSETADAVMTRFSLHPWKRFITNADTPHNLQLLRHFLPMPIDSPNTLSKVHDFNYTIFQTRCQIKNCPRGAFVPKFQTICINCNIFRTFLQIQAGRFNSPITAPSPLQLLRDDSFQKPHDSFGFKNPVVFARTRRSERRFPSVNISHDTANESPTARNSIAPKNFLCAL